MKKGVAGGQAPCHMQYLNGRCGTGVRVAMSTLTTAQIIKGSCRSRGAMSFQLEEKLKSFHQYLSKEIPKHFRRMSWKNNAESHQDNYVAKELGKGLSDGFIQS